MRSKALGFVTVVAALMVMSTTGALAADSAAATALASPPTVVENVPMTVDCTQGSASVQQYAVAHGLCPAGAGVAQPDNLVRGNCGDSFLYMSNARSGNASFRYGFDSSQGHVIDRNLVVSWVNWTRGVHGNFHDSIAMWNTHYSHTVAKYTQTGFVSGVLSGDVILWWGGICTISYPTSSTTVTH
jgi:hypothetical protein